MDPTKATELLSVHTNTITSNKVLIQEINSCSPPLPYAHVKQQLFHIAHSLHTIPTCANPKCTNIVKWDKRNQQYPNTCGYKCANSMQSNETISKRKKTNTERYGGNAPACDETIRTRMANTNVERYGDNYTEINVAKAHETVKHKYGVDNISQIECVKHKRVQTSLKRYGTTHPLQSEAVVNKSKQTCLERYDRINGNQTNISDTSYRILTNKHTIEDLHVNQQKPVSVIASKLDVSIYTVYNWLTKHNIPNQHHVNKNECSIGHQEIINFLNEYDINVVINDRCQIHPLELDIYLPDYNIAIEYNGLYWHSEANNKTSRYHLNKTLQCEENNIRLIHIFEDEWKNQQQQCKDTILHLLGKSQNGCYARDTTIREIPWSEARDFLNKYHLLSAGKSGNYRIGAYDKTDALIGVMVFGKQNNERSDADSVELRRFVTNKKNNPGLGSKMFKYAVRQNKYSEVVAFVDRRWFTGLVKSYIGFSVQYATDPAIWWTNGTQRHHRRFVTKDKLIEDGHNASLSKRDILNSEGFYRIWDCGKLKLLWKS